MVKQQNRPIMSAVESARDANRPHQLHAPQTQSRTLLEDMTAAATDVE